MTINRFEDLIAWQKARQLVAAVYGVTTKGAFAKDYGLRDQIQRSAVSIMSNIAEGFDRGSRPEFHKFLVIAKAIMCRSSLAALRGPGLRLHLPAGFRHHRCTCPTGGQNHRRLTRIRAAPARRSCSVLSPQSSSLAPT